MCNIPDFSKDVFKGGNKNSKKLLLPQVRMSNNCSYVLKLSRVVFR